MCPSLLHYDLLGELATGGMATVYLGRQRNADGSTRLVAVKSMRQELAEDEAFLAMFLDEATLTSKIKHPNVVPTLDVVSAGGRLLIVMEYVDGLSLAKLLEMALRWQRPIPAAISIGILCDVLRGLHAAHELTDADGRRLAVVHRDVSPQNVLVGVDGVARILDFGIAKAATQQHVTARGEIKGKLAYMPPEQQLAEGVDRRADVYAAGVVLWEMLAGRRLFSAGNEDELVRQVFEGRVDPPSLYADEQLSPEIDRIVLRALSRRREDRWWTAEEMAKALASALAPASRGDVVNLLHTLGRSECEQRATLIRELETRQGDRLEPEAQIVVDVLTRRRQQQEHDVQLRSQPHVQERQKQPQQRRDAVGTTGQEEAVLRGLEPSADGSGNAIVRATQPQSPTGEPRRDRRRKGRREMFIILGGIGIAIVVLMVLALVLGMSSAKS